MCGLNAVCANTKTKQKGYSGKVFKHLNMMIGFPSKTSILRREFMREGIAHSIQLTKPPKQTGRPADRQTGRPADRQTQCRPAKLTQMQKVTMAAELYERYCDQESYPSRDEISMDRQMICQGFTSIKICNILHGYTAELLRAVGQEQ